MSEKRIEINDLNNKKITKTFEIHDASGQCGIEIHFDDGNILEAWVQEGKYPETMELAYDIK